MTSVVTSSFVLEHFIRSDTARERFAWWKDDPKRVDVIPRVMAHRSRVVLDVTPADVEAVCRNTDHALERIRREHAESVEYIRDWTCPFAMTHIFHFITERDGAIPTWQQFKRRHSTPEFSSIILEPAEEAVDYCVKHLGISRPRAQDSMQWRIGNAYYSFLREQWVHAYLRSQGIGILQHPLADTLFAVDGWTGSRILSLFIGNPAYRASTSGRKRTAQERLAGSLPPFTFINMQLPVPNQFGEVFLPSRSTLDRYIRRELGNC
jgi:hypothetical protein